MDKRKAWISVSLVLTLLLILATSACQSAPTPTPTVAPTAAVQPTAVPTPTPMPAAEKKWVLKGATWIPSKTGPRWEVLSEFVKLVDEGTAGRVKIELTIGGALAPAMEEFDYLSRGLFDFTMLLDLWGETYSPTLGVGVMPGILTPDIPAVWDAGVLAVLDREANKKNVKLLQPWPTTGFQSYFHKTKFLKTLDDFKGQKINANGTYPGLYVSSMGAARTNVPAAEFYTALQSGVYEGIFASYFGGHDGKYYEVAPYVTVTATNQVYFNMSYMPAFNLKVWNTFPADIQQVISAAAARAGRLSYLAWLQGYAQALTTELSNPKINVHVLSEQEFQAQVKQGLAPMWDEYIKRAGAPGQEIKAIVDKFYKR